MKMDRRHFLRSASGLAALNFAAVPSAWASADADAPRLLVVMLRGGMDGLTAVPPVGDPDYEAIRPTIGIRGGLRLDGSFALHPAMKQLHQIWNDGQLAIVHATGFGYTGRSHFEGQDIMQSGMAKPYTSSSGWLGRAMQAAQAGGGVSISIPMPLILRGNHQASTQFPNWMPIPSEPVAQALTQVWASDPLLAPLAPVIQTESLRLRQTQGMRPDFGTARSLPELGRLAAEEMRAPQGPRLGLIDFTHGFDTHASQGGDTGSHADQLATLDRVVGAFKTHMGPMWAKSLVVTVTEFGRTAAENGTTGTDHGVGSCCLLAGGLVQESRVYAQWQGLRKPQLFEGRDLPATTDVAAVYARVVERVFGLPPAIIAEQVLAHRSSPTLKGLLGLG